MSKFLKFIVHLAIIGTILCVLALAVPQFFGIRTTVIDGSYTETNMLLGSVTYSKEIDPSEVQLGDDIVVENGKSVHRYQVVQPNLTEGTCLVKNPVIAGDYTETVSIRGGVWKTLFAVEYIGYLLVATQSKEGMIILLIAVLVLIILYIIAELWKKSPAEASFDEYEEGVEVKSAKELRREEKEKALQRKKEEKEMRENEKRRRKRSKGSTIRTGGFIDEISQEDEEIEEELRNLEKSRPEVAPSKVQEATSEAHEQLKKEIAAATTDLPEEPELELSEELKEFIRKETTNEEPELQELAIPLFTAEELAKKVQESGDTPEVMQDEVSKVVLFDYSDILNEDGE